MGNGFLFTLCALLLLSVFTLTAHRLIADNERSAEESEYYITAFSLAQSVIEEAKTKAFDQAAAAGVVTMLDSLTAPGALGPDAMESLGGPDTSSVGIYRSVTAFNDVDDYNGYVRVANTPRADNYTLTVSVSYASPQNPDSLSGTRSWCKTMTVTASSPYLSHPLSVQYAYFY